MRLIRIDHVSLNVADRDGSIAWYEDVLGLAASRRSGPSDEPIFVGPDGVRLGLFADRAPGLRHIALGTDDAGYAETVERLGTRGIAFREERHGDSRSVYFTDPDGTTIEVMTLPA
jgi:catechol 2,3-dioxygenase-like lactoylglutathione lyase family enzyme